MPECLECGDDDGGLGFGEALKLIKAGELASRPGMIEDQGIILRLNMSDEDNQLPYIEAWDCDGGVSPWTPSQADMLADDWMMVLLVPNENTEDVSEEDEDAELTTIVDEAELLAQLQERLTDYNDLARIVHEANRAWCEYLGDTSQTSWDDAPEWQRQSAINGVKFHVENPDAGDAASHNSWLREKRETGWKYGPVKNPDTKEHPCFVAFEELPKDQQFKDRLFRTIVRAALNETGAG